MYLSLGRNNQVYAQTAKADILLYSQVDNIPIEVFERLEAHQGTLHSKAYYRVIEQTQHGEMDFIYAVVYHQGGVIGLIYFQVVHFKGRNLIDYFPAVSGNSILDRIKSLGIGIGKKVVNVVNLPLLVSGNLFITGDMGMHYVLDLSPFEQSHYLSQAIDSIQQTHPYLKTVLLPGMYEPGGDFDYVFTHHSYRRIFMEPDMNMMIATHWHTFDDYLAALSSKYRVRVKKILSQCSRVEVRDMSTEQVVAEQNRIYELYKAVADRASFNIAKYHPQQFILQKQLMGEQYRILGFYQGERMVGFMSLITHDYKTEVHYCGIDYSLMPDIPIYQYMLYEVVRYAIHHQLRKLHFGRTAPEVKSTIGAIPLPMYGYIKYKNNIVNYLIQIFTNRLKPRAYLLRNPFRE